MAVLRDARRAADDRQDADRRTVQQSRRRWLGEWIRSLLIAFGLFLFIRTFVVEAFRIPTGSMENTLLVGDFLLVNKAVFGARVPFTHIRLPAFAEPARGDIVVFVPPHESGKNYVKRLIGIPGDTLAMQAGTLYLNGRPQDEPYVRLSAAPDSWSPAMFWQCEHRPAGTPGGECRPTRDNWGPLVVPDDAWFLMGDNRHDSEDSRYWGFVRRDRMRGKPLIIYYSYDVRSPRPVPWLSSIRWSRIGDRIH